LQQARAIHRGVMIGDLGPAGSGLFAECLLLDARGRKEACPSRSKRGCLQWTFAQV
jgi:hypothetical protein